MKKFLPYILIVIILIGLFSPTVKAQAAGNCIVTPFTGNPYTQPVENKEACDLVMVGNSSIKSVRFEATTADTQVGPCYVNGVALGPTYTGAECAAKGGTPTPPAGAKKAASFEDKLPICVFSDATNGTITGCFVQVAYYLFFALPAAILRLSASLFDAMLTLTLSTILYNNSFLPEAWRIARDFSNIFFILILLYIAIKLILGLGGAGIKKMIAQVIIVALLINFSMFFTQIVIDSSNILALIFYNKIALNVTKDGNKITPDPILDKSQTGVEEKNFSVGIVAAFDPTTRIPPEAWKAPTHLSLYQAVSIGVDPATALTLYVLAGQDFNTSLYLEVIFVSGAIFLFAAYAFLIAALAFIGRLIELWMCIIFAPFAFLSLTVPELAGTEYFGWKAWSKRLVSVAFMAPIFMFFIYLISKLIQARIFDKLTLATQGPGFILMIVIIPAIINLTLLMKAVHYAKKGAGQFGEAAVKYGGMIAGLAGGLALGAATGGASIAGTATLGRAGSALNNSASLKAAEARGGIGGFAAARLRNIGKFAGSSSFDARGIKIGGKDLAGVTGLKSIGKAKEGGFEKRRAEQVENRQKRAKELEVGEDEGLKQRLNELERDKQELLRAGSHQIQQLDLQIKAATEASSAAAALLRAQTPGTAARTAAQTEARNRAERVINLRRQKLDIKNATGADLPLLTLEATAARARAAAAPADVILANAARAAEAAENVARASAAGSGRSINELEDIDIPEAHHHIEEENRERKWNFARSSESAGSQTIKFIVSGGVHSFRGEREASHKIRMDAKVPDSGKMNNPPLTH